MPIITVDIEAYDLLARRKRSGQFFSDVIKEQFGPKRTLGDFLEAVRAIGPEVSEQTLRLVRDEVRRRKADLAEAPRL